VFTKLRRTQTQPRPVSLINRATTTPLNYITTATTLNHNTQPQHSTTALNHSTQPQHSATALSHKTWQHHLQLRH